jgi:small-conductance mechanosensitive channel
VGSLLAAPPLRAAHDDERAANLQEQIRTLTVVVDAAKTPAEKSRLDEKLQRLREELQILQSRQALEARERALTTSRRLSAIEALHDKLRGITAATDEADERARQLTARNRQLAAERDALAAQAEAGKGKLTANNQAELDERVFTRNEELRALALEREAAEADGELAREADRLRERLKAGEAARARSTLRGLFEAYTQLRDERKIGDQLAMPAASLEQILTISQSSLDLAQQKLARFDEELALLEKQTGFFNRDDRVERLLAEQRSQKNALVERLPFLARQIEAIKHAQRALKQRQECQELAVAFHAEQWDVIEAAYQRRLRWPIAALVGLVALHLLTSYLLLPLVSKNETLFLTRRLMRYGLALAGMAVIAGFLFDDLSMVAATLGVVSAALVISLQDVCTSIAAWFVIMAGGKFGIGDRLEIEGTRGDVLDIQLLRTTLLELNGWLGVDQPTGRVMVIPNNFIFKHKVFNFNHGHPFVWSKIDLTVTFATPIAQAQALFMHVLEHEAASQFAAAQGGAAGIMLKRYGVDESDFKPKIYTVIATDGVTLTLLFVAHYREVSSTRSRINRRLIAELETHREIQLAFHTVSVLHETPLPGAPAAVLGQAGPTAVVGKPAV